MFYTSNMKILHPVHSLGKRLMKMNDLIKYAAAGHDLSHWNLKRAQKSCVFVIGHAYTQNIKNLYWDIAVEQCFSCSCCLVYGFNMLHYVGILPSVFFD